MRLPPYPLTGVLLHYDGGRRRALGSIRLDCLGPTLPVGDSSGMSLRIVKLHDVENSYRVESIAMTKAWDHKAVKNEVFTAFVPWNDKLEWFVSAHRCYLDYKGTRLQGNSTSCL